MLGRRAPDLFPDFEPRGLADLARRALEGEVVAGPDTQNLRGRNPGAWLSSTYSPLRGAGGQVDGVIVSVRAITERKEAEEAVAREQAALAEAARANARSARASSNRSPTRSWRWTAAGATPMSTAGPAKSSAAGPKT